MLRSAPRFAYHLARPNRLSNGKACAAAVAPPILEAASLTTCAARRSVRSWGSWTGMSGAVMPGHHPARGQQASLLCASTVVVPGRSKSSQANAPKWEHEELPVLPVLEVDDELPSNLKLAEEAWLEEEGEEEEEQEEEQEEVDGESEAETLSEEEKKMFVSLHDIPTPASAGSLEMEVVSWANGTPVGTISLPPSVFGVPVRRDVVHDVVRWQLARRRKGNGQTKRIGEVSGSGRKVRPQKGGGVARAGHSRPPHWRGGAKAHGPRRRDFSFKLNKKFVKLGLRVALSARLREGQLTVVDNLESKTFSTSDAISTMRARGLDDHVTFIVGEDPQTEFLRSTTNIVGTKVLAARGANVYDIIKRPHLVLTRDAVARLEESHGTGY